MFSQSEDCQILCPLLPYSSTPVRVTCRTGCQYESNNHISIGQHQSSVKVNISLQSMYDAYKITSLVLTATQSLPLFGKSQYVHL